MSNPESKYFVDIFPINKATIPKLYAYRLEINQKEIHTIGGKFAYRCNATFDGNWVFASKRLITDHPVDVDLLKEQIEGFYRDQSKNIDKATELYESSLWSS